MDKVRKSRVFDEGEEFNLEWKRSSVPRITGRSSQISGKILSGPMGKHIVAFIKKNGIYSSIMGLCIEDDPKPYPIFPCPSGDNVCKSDTKLESLIHKDKTLVYSNISDFHTAYLNRYITPTEVIDNLIKVRDDENIKTLKCIVSIDVDSIKKAAADSSERYKENRHLSVIDGVPFFVHEELKLKGYESYMGTSCFKYLGDSNASVIQMLIDLGAICCGYCNMVQFGSNSIGINPSKVRPSVLNPWNSEYYCGGSASGIAAAVAAGLAPFCIGVEGIGSLRLTAGMTGMVGFKPTFGRIRDNGSIYSEGSPFSLLGPITSCVRDAAIIYGIINTRNPEYLTADEQPALEVPSLENFNFEDVIVGLCPEYIEKCSDPKLSEQFYNAITKLKSNGMRVKKVQLTEMKETFCSCILGFTRVISETVLHRFGPDVTKKVEDSTTKVFLEFGKSVDDELFDIINRQRGRMMDNLRNLFKQVDMLITLTSCCLPEKYRKTDNQYGVIDDYATNGHTMFTFLASFCGLPSISVNMGYDEETGLPMSLQITSRWWDDVKLINFAHKVEKTIETRRRPRTFVSLLE